MLGRGELSAGFFEEIKQNLHRTLQKHQKMPKSGRISGQDDGRQDLTPGFSNTVGLQRGGSWRQILTIPSFWQACCTNAAKNRAFFSLFPTKNKNLKKQAANGCQKSVEKDHFPCGFSLF